MKAKLAAHRLGRLQAETPPSLPASAEAAPHSPQQIEMSATIGGTLPPAMQARRVQYGARVAHYTG